MKSFINIGKRIEAARSDMVYLGNGSCDVMIDKAHMFVFNPKLIKTYTIFEGTTEVTTVYFDYKLDSNGYVLEVTVTMEGEPYMILSLEYK